ncbi:Smr/MutS family protein [Nannocystis bainbridge]|uniref:Smr/MutS family protein n=1 Tax=Nannocystis bainbridge TaxID=2995303 RepID=A0ABT5DSP4_9BACT|nr:Smr/MutS family protein [Nannocystis bainbridge]MDC0715411.1 Smr/MutS family protein [Nannocystis bainbridge]
MPRRRRPGRTGAPPRSAPPEPEGRLRAPLAALFPDGLPSPPPPPPPAPPPPRLVSERELMARAFAALATGDALDFEAMRVVASLAAATGPKRQVLSTSPSVAAKPTKAATRAGSAPSPGATTLAANSAPASAGASPATTSPPATSAPASSTATDPAAPAPRDPQPSRPVAALQQRAWAGAGWRDEPGRSHDPARTAAELVARARRGRLPTLRLRGLRREPALEALIAFVTRERAARSRYVRIVTGKGLGSPGDPVLKETLALWCASSAGEADVVAWAPEVDVRGEYGSVILQLRPLT